MTATPNACPQCGSARQGTLRYCSNCGFDYWKAAEQSSDPTQPVPVQATGPTSTESDAVNGKPSRRGLWIALGIAALVIVLIIGALSGNDDEPAAGDGGASPSATSPATPSPTGEPTASVAATTPTIAPTPTPSPAPTPTPEPAFATIELSGSGNAVPRFEIPADAAAIADITHAGSANFALWTIDQGGSQTDLMVNVIGNYAGTALFDETAGSHSVAFEVEASGSWTIAVKPVAEAFRWDGVAMLTGSGDDVAILDPPSAGLMTVTATHSGDGNFAIWAYAESTDLLVNEIGTFSGEVLLPDGTFLFEIQANGPWTISPPQ
jgi:hypothetical protein